MNVDGAYLFIHLVLRFEDSVNKLASSSSPPHVHVLQGLNRLVCISYAVRSQMVRPGSTVRGMSGRCDGAWCTATKNRLGQPKYETKKRRAVAGKGYDRPRV